MPIHRRDGWAVLANAGISKQEGNLINFPGNFTAIYNTSSLYAEHIKHSNLLCFGFGMCFWAHVMLLGVLGTCVVMWLLTNVELLFPGLNAAA